MASVVTREEVRRLVDERHAQVVDVLPAAEFSEEHLPGAVSLPLKELNAEAAGEILDRGRPVITYCHDYL